MAIPRFQKLTIQDREINQIQDNVAKVLNQLTPNPLLSGNLLQGVALVTGTNIINHLLGRNLIGWYTTRVRGACQLYDTQDTNLTPNLTLVIESDADVTVDLAVF